MDDVVIARCSDSCYEISPLVAVQPAHLLQCYRHTYIQTYKHIYAQTYMHTYRQTDIQAHIHKDMCTHTNTHVLRSRKASLIHSSMTHDFISWS